MHLPAAILHILQPTAAPFTNLTPFPATISVLLSLSGSDI